MGEIYTSEEQAKFKSKIQHNKKKIKLITFFITIVLPGVLLIMLTMHLAHALNVRNDAIAENKACILKRENLQRHKKALKSKKKYLMSRNGKIRTARENDFVMPGERVIIFEGDKKPISD